MSRTGLNLAPSPLRVFDRALFALRQDPVRPLLAMTIFFLLPYLAGYFVIYKPLIDGSHDYALPPSPEYLARYYGFILLYFVLRALASVTAGRLIHERLKGQPTTFRRVTVEAPWLWLRGLLVYLLLFGVSYLCQYLWLPSAIPVAIVAGFVLPPFMLDRQGLITALRTAWNVARGRWLAALVTASLLTGFGYGAQWLIDWANGHFAGALSFALASVALNVAFALVQLVQSACMLSLYANCRELSRPPGDVAEVFE